MLALSRTAPKRISKLAIKLQATRAFADVVGTLPNKSAISSAPPAPQASFRSANVLSKDRISVREDHGLYAFFKRKEGDDLVGDARYEVVETPEKVQRVTGRSWKASELRLKSFQDLHTLWYILLRERNVLATQKEEARRMGVDNTATQVSLEKVHQCRKSMARIKAVINERRLAYEGAVKLAEEQREKHHDEVVLRHQVAQFNTERKYLQRRREHKARMEAKRLKNKVDAQEAITTQENVSETVLDLSPADHIEKEAKEGLSGLVLLQSEMKAPGIGSEEETESENPPPPQSKALDAATALPGDVQTSKHHQ